MTTVGGSVVEVSIAGQNFAVASDADVKLRLGGAKLTAHRNGNGTTRYTSESEPWLLGNIELAIDSSSDQLVFLQNVADQMEPVDCVITLADDTKYQGSGTLVGDRDFSTAKATMVVTLMGSDQLTQQA